METGSRILLLTRQGCHLCEQAQATIESVADRLDVSWCYQDVDSDPQLRAEYSDHVPVTFVDGQLLSRWFLDPNALVAALAAEPNAPK